TDFPTRPATAFPPRPSTDLHRFTIAGLGKDLATSVGLKYDQIVLLGTAMVALSTGVTTVVVGFIPFLGLIVPNIVSKLIGDGMRSEEHTLNSCHVAISYAVV